MHMHTCIELCSKPNTYTVSWSSIQVIKRSGFKLPNYFSTIINTGKTKKIMESEYPGNEAYLQIVRVLNTLDLQRSLTKFWACSC